MERGKILVDRDQVDLFDDENENPGWIYYLTHVLQVVYMLGFVATTVLFVNAYVVHTHFFPGAPNNDLYSDRYTSLWWLVLCFSTARFLFFLCMQWMFTFRNTMCCRGRYAGCTVFWMVFMILLFALDFVALLANSYYLATCNGLDSFGNPCNAAGWCCLPEVRVRPGNHCPNEFSGSCPVVPTINKNGTFIGIFSVNVIFVVLELYFVLLPVILWFINFRTIPTAAASRKYKMAPLPSEPEAVKPSAPPSEEKDPSLQDGEEEEEEGEPRDNMGVRLLSRPVVSGGPDSLVLRRPVVVPQTPLLAAAKAAQAPPLIAHVTPATEKNTKQP